MSRTVGALLVCALAITGCREKPAAPIILISIDTLRADRLRAYGAKHVDTPAIDRLAADGVVFENAYAHVPLTLPSHATMMTGTLPYDSGVRDNVGYRLADAGPTLPRLLAAQGYATGGAVSSYVLRGATGMGALFDFYDDSMEVSESATLGALQRRGDDTVRAALGFVDGVRDKPFFLFLHLFEPHSPYEPVEPFRSRYANPYDGEIAAADAILGRFLAELERRGLYDDALIVLVSDHGEGLGDHGEAEHGVLLYREALHVPLIVKLPGRRMSGRRVAAPAQLADLLPTLAGAAGAKLPAQLAGVSLIELAEGRAPATRAIYSETLYPRLHLGWSELRSLTDARHQYIESPAPELYDFVGDPRETKNLRDERRRESHALSASLARVPLKLVAPGAADAEERARLAALGYLSGAAAAPAGPPRNPREHIAVLAQVEQIAVLDREGRLRESAELSRQILRAYPELVDVYVHLAATLRRLGELREARDAYREAIRRSPQLVDTLTLEVAKLELDIGNLDAAELNARQAAKLNPAEAHLILAGIAMERGDWTSAEREAQLAAGDAERPRVPALILLAQVLARQGKHGEALAAIDRAKARVDQDGAPPVPTLASTRGDILALLKRDAEAEAAFRLEMQRFPTTSAAYTKLAILLAQQHRFTEIQPTLEAMVSASPAPATYALAADVLSRLGNTVAARDFQRRGARLAGK